MQYWHGNNNAYGDDGGAQSLHHFQHSHTFQYDDAKQETVVTEAEEEFISLNSGDFLATSNVNERINHADHVEVAVPQFPSLTILDVNDVLPHKKRISRKLKAEEEPTLANVEIQVMQNNLPEERQIRVTTLHDAVYSCELCGHQTSSQLQFFTHLKEHYEPQSHIILSEASKHTETAGSVVQSAMHEVTSMHDVTNINVTSFTSVQPSVTDVGHNNSEDDIKILNSGIDLKCFFESPSEAQPLKGIIVDEVEFSDNEDMLEGIRNVVNKVFIEDTCDDIDLLDSFSGIVCKNKPFSDISFNGTLDQVQNDTDVSATNVIRTQSKEVSATNQHLLVTKIRNTAGENKSSELIAIKKNKDYSDVVIEQQQLLTVLTSVNDKFSRREKPPSNDRDNQNELINSSPNTNCFNDIQNNDDYDEDHDDIVCQFSEPFTTKNPDSKKNRKSIVTNSMQQQNKGKKYICMECKREFNSSNALKYHANTHTGVRPYQCDVCGSSFFAQSALKSHQNTHTGVKPFECEHCQRKFRQWGDLNYHLISIHSGEKSHQCEFCGKAFARKYSLVLHRRIHTSEYNYKCEFCNKTFRASTYLQNHRKIHTGEKPYECNICQKKFRVSGDFRRHMRIHQRNGKSNNHMTIDSKVVVDKWLSPEKRHKSKTSDA